MEAPVCLVENRPDGLHPSPEALRLLSDIRNPVVVVSIVGLYRTGKSYLMNRLAGKTPGFSLGSTVQAKMKGIWMWCLPYSEWPRQTLVLLDTEGLGDIQKGSPQTDAWIFALAVLLSSTLVYNSVGTIDQTALDKLHFVTELSEHIKAKASSLETSEFVRFFPTFFWTVRDFTMQLEWDGQPITEDEYLEHALELKKGKGPAICKMKKMKAKASELEQEVQKQEMEMLKEKLEDEKQSHEMNLQKLKEKMVEERNQIREENKKMIENKLKEQEAFFKEGFEQETSQLEEEIQQLKKKSEAMEESKNPLPFSGVPSGGLGEDGLRRDLLGITKPIRSLAWDGLDVTWKSWTWGRVFDAPPLGAGCEESGCSCPHPLCSCISPKARMEAPVCLVENRKNRLRVCSEALDLLSEIRKPVVVVAIVGLYRTGKSYLMNKLAGKSSGFSLGSTVQAKTKGIWMWCIPYPDRPKQTLVLLDTEGLGDVEKGSSQNDAWIFALAVLLSSTLVYNSVGTIDQNALDKLHFVTELSEYIKAKASSSPGDADDSSEFVGFFPTFVWTVRDFALQLERDGQSITEDEYLEHALELKKGDSQEKQIFNLPRTCIRLFFPTWKCFVFDCPTKSRNLRYLEKMVDNQLEPEFVEQTKKFCHYIYEASQEKTLPGGHVVTGNLLAKLVETYVDTISSGNIPCLENTVSALAEIENRAALQEAVACYEQLMDQSLQLPTDSLQELLDKHKTCEEQALQMFMARAFKDDTRQYQVELMKTMESKKEDYCKKNKEKSSEICSALLTSLSEGLEQNIKNGSYFRAGGHQEYLNDLQKVEKQFYDTPKKGIMAWRKLNEFHRGKEGITKAILQNDIALQLSEKEKADEQMKTKAKELEKEVQKQEKEMSKQKSEDHRQSREMNFHMLKKKRMEEKKKRLEEYEKMIESKLREQKALLEEGFEKEASQLNEDIKELRKKKEEVENPSWISSALENLRSAIHEKFSKIHDAIVEPVVDRFKTLTHNRTSKD
ncbi:LOW QUALITY PROTEIN: guanylate-binding protein 2-like [Vipera latastei]